mgnify:CR=1 FL=1
MANEDVRRAAAVAGLRLWQVAERLGVADSNFSRRLRRELSPEEKARIFDIINELAGGDGNADTEV